MRIGFICIKNSRTSGGVEKYTIEMAKRLSEKGNEVYVYTTDNEDIPVISGVNFIYVPSIRIGSLEKITGSFFATLIALLHGLDIFHYQAFGAGVFSFVPRLFGKISVAQGHGIEWKRAKWGAFAKLVLMFTEAMSVKFSTSVLTVSGVQADDIEKRYNRKAVVIPGGISPIDNSKSEVLSDFDVRPGRYFLFVGRLVAEKGAHYLIDAFKTVKNHEYKLVIAGGGDDRDDYYRELRKKSVHDSRIIFAGFQSQNNLSVLYMNALSYVIPSELEGRSLSLLDALAYGSPSIASDIPENIEALEDGKFGVLFENKNSNDLSLKINDMISNSNTAMQVAAEAKQYVRNRYNWDSLAEILFQHYKDIIYI